MRDISIHQLTHADFAPFGDIITLKGTPDKLINQDICGRHHDLANMYFGPNGKAGISLFDAEPRSLPYVLELMERHPEGSQAFLPMTQNPFLVIVAPDNDGVPGKPLAFRTAPGQGINFYCNIWHGVLTPLFAPGLFAVVDRIGTSTNLEEYWFEKPFTVSGDLK
jgi:ureidoglycolate lyase